MTIQIRMATLADIDELSRMFNGYRMFYEQSDDVELARRFLTRRIENKESTIFVADNGDGSCCGFTQLFPSFSSVAAQHQWILNDLYVDKRVRHQGVGRQLMNAAKDFALENKAKRIVLETGAGNANAQALYESLDYETQTDTLFYSLELDS